MIHSLVPPQRGKVPFKPLDVPNVCHPTYSLLAMDHVKLFWSGVNSAEGLSTPFELILFAQALFRVLDCIIAVDPYLGLT